MTTYIQDKNNAESIANNSTVLNATNYGNLTYKVDELQFVLNELHKYKHTTIISSIKDSWASKSWLNFDSGVKSDDTTNYILNGQSIKFTGSSENDGIHLEKTLDLTTHADAYTAGADDLITFFCYISSADLADLTAGGHSAQLTIGFYDDVLGTVNNFYYARFDDQLKAGKNIVKLKKSDFSNIGAPDWSTINGIDIYLSNDDPNAEIAISVDMILLHGQDFEPFVIKAADQSVNTDTTVNNDDELVTILPQNGIFEVVLYLSAYSASSTPDIKFTWTVSGDLVFDTYRYITTVPNNVADASDANRRVEFHPYTQETGCGLDGSAYSIFKERFIVSTGNDGGTLQLQWAQIVSNGTDVTVKAGSYMKITRVQ